MVKREINTINRTLHVGKDLKWKWTCEMPAHELVIRAGVACNTHVTLKWLVELKVA